jgi:hypothetical protein
MYKEEYGQEGGEMEGGCCGSHMDMMGMMMHHMKGESKREFKLALLKKKEKMLEAKLAFIRDMMEMVKKMPMEEKKDM